VTSEHVPSERLVQEAEQILVRNQALTSADIVLRLRSAFPDISPEVVGLAAETATLRRTALQKLGGWASEGIFSRALLEQASRTAIAQHRARFFEGCRHILEIGTGTGADTAELARVVGHVTTVECDPQRCQVAQHNLRVQGVSNVTFLCGDAQHEVATLDLSSFDGLFADPARRTRDGSRLRESDEYLPPLSWLLNIAIIGVRAIKVSPGLWIDPQPGWTRQFVGFEDECLEQTLWFGSSNTDSSVHLADHDCTWIPSANYQPTALASSLSGYLIEAHGAINRSQHLRSFFTEHGIHQVAPNVAYGISETRPRATPFLCAFSIVDSFPFNKQALSERVHSLGWTSRCEFKKRNYSGDLDLLRKDLHLPPHTHDAPFGSIFIFPWRDTTWVVLTRRVCD